MLPLDFYLSQHSRLPAAPMGDLLTGQTVILTGANSGEPSPPFGPLRADMVLPD